MKNIKINPSACIGCGTCSSLAGKSFKIGDDGKAHVLSPVGDTQEVIQSAIDSCPVTAISWEE